MNKQQTIELLKQQLRQDPFFIFISNQKNKIMFTTSLERLEQIETERSTTVSDPQFREWMKTLNVSRSYKDQEPKMRGAELTRQYDYSNKINIHF